VNPLLIFGFLKSIIDYKAARQRKENLNRVRKLVGDLEKAEKVKNRQHTKEVHKALLEIGKDGF
jgi:hypothetical protein